MERDEAEIRRLLWQPMGGVAQGVAFGWLHRYATDALAAAREGGLVRPA